MKDGTRASRIADRVKDALKMDDAANPGVSVGDVYYLLRIAEVAEQMAELIAHPDSCFKGGCECGLSDLESALEDTRNG